MQVLEKSDVRQASAKDVDAYIEKVMRELLYPFFLRKRVHQAIYEFLCEEFGLDEAISELPADQLSFRIGEPRDVAQDFAAVCRYAWLRGKMPAWKKWVIAAALVALIVLIVLLALYVITQLAYDHGDWAEGLIVIDSYEPLDDLPLNT